MSSAAMVMTVLDERLIVLHTVLKIYRKCNCNFMFPTTNAERLELTDWGRVAHICVRNITIIGSDNGLSPCRCQAIIWTSDGILLIRPLRTTFSEISIEMQICSFKKMRLKVSSAKWLPFCLGLNVFTIIHVLSGHFTSVVCTTLMQCPSYWIMDCCST